MTKPSSWWRRLLALAELAGDIDQRDIAHRLHVSDATISGWKSGAEPRPEAVRKAARAYSKYVDADTDELFRQLKDIAYPLDPDDPEVKKRGPKDRVATKVYEGLPLARLRVIQ